MLSNKPKEEIVTHLLAETDVDRRNLCCTSHNTRLLKLSTTFYALFIRQMSVILSFLGFRLPPHSKRDIRSSLILAVWIGSYLPTFRDNLEDGSEGLSRNVGNQLPM